MTDLKTSGISVDTLSFATHQQSDQKIVLLEMKPTKKLLVLILELAFVLLVIKMKPSAYHSGETEADNSQTPWWLIRQLQDITNLNFVHDICARENSVKSSSGSFWSKEDNALIIDWANDQFPFGPLTT